jgi:hypothetical protein
MSRINVCAFATLMLAVFAPAQVSASPACLKGQKPFELSGDMIEYSMSIGAGADCIQGLRWSFMQVYAVWPLKKPAHGELVMVGPGFRYFAKPDFTGIDKFTLVVVGKNRHEEGFSTVEITVSPQDAPPKVAPARQPDAALMEKLADAAPAVN